MKKIVYSILISLALIIVPTAQGASSYSPAPRVSTPPPVRVAPPTPAPAPKPAPAPVAPKPATPAPKPSVSKPPASSSKATPAPSKKPSGAGAGTASFTSKRPTPSRPSTGKLPQKPTTVLVPSARPSGIRVPSGRNYRTDAGRFRSNPGRYADPYSRDYYGNPASPLHYLYLYALADSISSNDPVRYEQVRATSNDSDSDDSWLWWLLIPGIAIVAIGGGFYLARK